MNAPTEFARAVCPHDCPDTCAMRVTVENGRAIKVVGDPEHPPTQGALCTKVSRYAERVYHPHRLTTPMKRVGRKGEGRFEPISWDEAFELAADASVGNRAPRAGSDLAVQLRRHDGSGSGRQHRAAVLSQARRIATRPHDLRGGRRGGPEVHLRRGHRHAHRVFRRERGDPDLGHRIPSRRICISGHAPRKPSVAARA